MLLRWHLFLGAIFTFLFWILAPTINKAYLILLFAPSFLMGIDYARRGKSKIHHGKGFLHTIEVQIILAFLSLVITPLLYLFLGMIFHFFLDLGYDLYSDNLSKRDFFLYSILVSKG